MATIGIQIGCLIMAIPMVIAGIQGLRGIPDSSKGQRTSKPVAIACLLLAAVVIIGSCVVLPLATESALSGQ
jgi:hypothetical protein